MAFGYGVPMAMHFAGTPVSCMANVHCAAATRNFLALEKPIIQQDYIKVPDTPGFGRYAER
jgi:L-alanine-DL-glutamate epimerase-like enolase superfamily enzyme